MRELQRVVHDAHVVRLLDLDRVAAAARRVQLRLPHLVQRLVLVPPVAETAPQDKDSFSQPLFQELTGLSPNLRASI